MTVGKYKRRVYERPKGQGWVTVISYEEEEEDNVDGLRAEQIIVEMLMSCQLKKGGDNNGGMDPID